MEVAPPIKFPIDKQQFVNWAKNNYEEFPCKGLRCPLEQAVLDILGYEINVSPNTWYRPTAYKKYGAIYQLPLWAKRLNRYVDNRTTLDWNEQSGKYFVEGAEKSAY